MASAYAALISLQNLIDKIQLHHASNLKSLGQNPLLEDLRGRARPLQRIVQGSCSRVLGAPDEDINAAEGLEHRIAAAAYATEDLLESHVVDRILSEDSHISEPTFGQRLKEVIEKMDHILLEDGVRKISKLDKEEEEEEEASEDLEQPTDTTPSAQPGSSAPLPWRTSGKNAMHENLVGFDQYLNQLKEMLNGGGVKRQAIPIFGMGGIGKTTLAKAIHVDPLIKEYFDLRAWATITQDHNACKILSSLLVEIGESVEQDMSSTVKLGEKLHKVLYGRRYLIILDDIWSVEAWNEVKLYLPDNDNGSRILITTRMSNLHIDSNSSSQYSGSWGLKIEFLDDDKSWNLLGQKVFGDEGCLDLRLERLGRMIAKKCKGLPLSIITIAGLLAKSEKTPEYWNHVSENLDSIVASDDDEYCLKILYLSYQHLPAQLKPCFLYMGVLPEDEKIGVSRLVKLWVAEGFLEFDKVKSSEEVAYDCLKDLIDRNLILLNGQTRRGKMKACYIHDVLRNLCLRECHKEKFLFVPNVIQKRESQRRLAIHQNKVENVTEEAILRFLEPVPLVRTFSTYHSCDMQLSSPMYRLLRVAGCIRSEGNENLWRHVNLRYLEFKLLGPSEIPSSINLLWNLETLHIHGKSRDKPVIVPVEIWEMPQLRHLMFEPFAILPDPASCQAQADNHGSSIALRNLETLASLMNFKVTEDVTWRIPYVKRLKICCSSEQQLAGGELRDSCVMENLGDLERLESLSLSLSRCPHSLHRDNWKP